MGDRHVGVKRCLHPQARRAAYMTGGPVELLGRYMQGGVKEQCLECRAVRYKKVTRRQDVRWGPWVSAGQQVLNALRARDKPPQPPQVLVDDLFKIDEDEQP